MNIDDNLFREANAYISLLAKLTMKLACQRGYHWCSLVGEANHEVSLLEKLTLKLACLKS